VRTEAGGCAWVLHLGARAALTYSIRYRKSSGQQRCPTVNKFKNTTGAYPMMTRQVSLGRVWKLAAPRITLAYRAETLAFVQRQ
jgi:hypothetical protein